LVTYPTALRSDRNGMDSRKLQVLEAGSTTEAVTPPAAADGTLTASVLASGDKFPHLRAFSLSPHQVCLVSISRLTNPRRDHDGGDGGDGDGGDGGDANLRPNHRSILHPNHRSGALCCGVPREGRNDTPTPGSNDIRHVVQHGQEGRNLPRNLHRNLHRRAPAPRR